MLARATRVIHSLARQPFNRSLSDPSPFPVAYRRLCAKANSSKPHNNTTLNKPAIPDVPSTSWSSLGFEEKDAKDPNKWKKFAWKYAGAVLLFMISYKTLHWYTDRLEADAKRKRKEMEEDREIAHQIRTSDPQSERFPFMEPLKDVPSLPETSSELDELYAYKAQLENDLRALKSQSGTSQTRQQTNQLETELKDLANDIALLEMKKPPS